MNIPFGLNNKTILVTGGSSGIGREVACSIAKQGGKVVVVGRNEQRLSETLQLLGGEGHRAVLADLTSAVDLEKLVEQVDVLDGIVHSAGILFIVPARLLAPEQLEQITASNYLAPVNLTIALLRGKKVRSKSSVVFITSINGPVKVVKGFGGYAASKSALNAFMKVLALEYASKQIRFNSVAPGMIKTQMYYDMEKTVSAESIAEDKLKYPLGDYGDPEDVANACIYLLSDASKWVTGTSLVVDGGHTII